MNKTIYKVGFLSGLIAFVAAVVFDTVKRSTNKHEAIPQYESETKN